MIRVDGLSKTFLVHHKQPGLLGSLRSAFLRKTVAKPAVCDVSFEISRGEIVGLLGANGAGKTTVVKMLAGIIHPTSGDASVLGYRPWERDNRFRSQIALIMGQKAQLWWDLPAADCFLLLREIYRVPPGRHEENLRRLADVLGVRDLLTTQVRRLSLGERMKMELIAALLHDPRVVFLDEPTIGLDINAQVAIREFILEYQSELEPAMILTSHYMEDIERLCERIIILREGRVVYDGSLARVVDQYATGKVITVHLEESGGSAPPPAELGKVGHILESTSALLRVHVPRDSVAEAAAHLLAILPVRDLAIEEEEVGTIIANIMSAQAEDAP